MNRPASHSVVAAPPVRPAIPRDGLTEFEMRLAFRTKVPADRLHEFLSWSPPKLRREAQIVSRIVKRFAEAVVSSMENPSSTDEFLRTLDLKSISRDHDWRAIFSTIRVQQFGYESYKRSVLIRYLQYLSFRKRLLEFIYARKQGLDETDRFQELTEYPAPVACALVGSPDLEDEFANFNGARQLSGEFRRLPLGESMEIGLERGEKKEVLLAGHLFRLIGGQPPSIIDQNGVTYFLKDGRNMVGRHPESDVAVDQNFSDISRAHLIIEWGGAGRVMLIDLSSRGTFVREKTLREATNFDMPEHAFDRSSFQGEPEIPSIN